MPKLFEVLRERLLVAGIAPRHIRRYLAELGDHLADLRGQGLDEAAALARLGGIDDLAQPMIARPEFRSLAARYPRTVLGVGPVALWFSVMVGTAMMLVITKAFEVWTLDAINGLAYVVLRVLPVALSATTLIAAMRQRSALIWPVVGAALVLILSCTSEFWAFPSTVSGSKTELQITCWILPFLVPFTDAVGPMNGSKVIPGLLQAAGILAAIMAGSRLWRRHQQHTEQHHD